MRAKLVTVIGAAVLLTGGTGAAYAAAGGTAPSPGQSRSTAVEGHHAASPVSSPVAVAADDHGADRTEPGDDRGTHVAAEPGDDRGIDVPAAGTRTTADDHGGSRGRGSDDGPGHH